MFRIVLIALALHGAGLHGLATWYGSPGFNDGDIMADGTPLALDAPTVAVDVSLRHLLGRDAIVLTECGGFHKVRIADTGHLHRAGFFRLGVRAGCLRYWPVGEPPEQKLELAERVLDSIVLEPKTDWLEDGALPVVADFPQRYFAREVACEVDGWGKGDTTEIWLWVLPND